MSLLAVSTAYAAEDTPRMDAIAQYNFVLFIVESSPVDLIPIVEPRAMRVCAGRLFAFDYLRHAIYKKCHIVRSCARRAIWRREFD